MIFCLKLLSESYHSTAPQSFQIVSFLLIALHSKVQKLKWVVIELGVLYIVEALNPYSLQQSRMSSFHDADNKPFGNLWQIIQPLLVCVLLQQLQISTISSL